MNDYTLFSNLVGGLGINILVTLLAMILPLGIGIGLTLLMHFTRKTALPKIFRYVAILTEGLCPTAILMLYFFGIPITMQNLFSSFRLQPFACAILTLSVCFTGYMVFRYCPQYSLAKNLVVNGIGLVADMLKWCFAIVSFIGVSDLIYNAKLNFSVSYNPTAYLWVAVISFIVLAALYVARQLCKDCMK